MATIAYIPKGKPTVKKSSIIPLYKRWRWAFYGSLLANLGMALYTILNK